MISLKQLHYALAVSQTRHFRKASQLCNVSQSALSSAISELESQLDVQIFERDNKKVLVTTLGEQILERAQQVMTQIDDIEQLAKSHSKPLSQPMSLGAIPTIGPYLLPQVLPALRNAYPDLELTIAEEQSSVLVDKVKRGELDTAVLALPYDTDGLLCFEFWKEDFYALSHRDLQPENVGVITREQLQQSKLLLLKEGHCLTDHALSVCQMPRPQNEKGLAGTSLYTLVQMVAGRMGTTLVPEMALPFLLPQNPELSALKLDEPGPHRRLAFIVRPNYAGLASIELLKKLFIGQLALNSQT
ncbi:hydrogen peroxide-inducible genes activator [Reinekea marinisedimentorum]|uniref:LysR family hydrogen peroxide-inducible transcriptional activator n=1 Tax=Reinekea marinisedimentorum TaxID=230495 RepID=A0A4R3IDF6_9GAMM|nr:hydrogen peroxide-inducible genes activator [Reinekea marinisedimentorum]TCS43767.1 LysR family hydrogen peroxide-inducible transcriptional activator [Reinekea marinisedimentorum]